MANVNHFHMNWYELEVFPPRNYGDLFLGLVISAGSWPPVGFELLLVLDSYKHLKYFCFSVVAAISGILLQVCDFSKTYGTIKLHTSGVV